MLVMLRINCLRLRKVVSERESNGITVYVVDGKDYSEAQLIEMANSVV